MAKRKRTQVKGRWSADEVRLLKKTYRNRSTKEVAAELNRSARSVSAKAFALSLRKTKKYLKSMGKK